MVEPVQDIGVLLSPIMHVQCIYLLFRCFAIFYRFPVNEKESACATRDTPTWRTSNTYSIYIDELGSVPSDLTALLLCSNPSIALPMVASTPVLSAVGSAEELHLLNIIILIVSVLSALGSAWMILSFVVSNFDGRIAAHH